MSSLPTLLYPYCTVRDAQLEAQNDDPDSVADLTIQINQASRWIDGYCRRDFLFHDHTADPLRIDESWCAGNVIYLPWPIITLSEVRVGGIALGAGETRHFQRLGSANSRIERNGPWLPQPASNVGISGSDSAVMAPMIEVIGSFGYVPATTAPESTPAPTLPAEIRQACAAIAAIRSGLVRREIIGYGGTRESITVRSIPKPVISMLDRYRIPVI